MAGENPVTQSTGQLIIISGPSGAGKSTVVERVLERFANELRLSVSATTRPPRPGEIDGRHYHFLAPEEFARRRKADEFLECMEVFGRGHWYGTLLSEVRPSLAAGKSVLLEIDVDGAEQALTTFPRAVTIFIRPGSEAELERRLRGRGTEQEEAIQRRLEVARRELERAGRYQYQVVNDTVDHAVDEVCEILRSRGLREA
jgi:guanylate kinase